MNTEVMFSRASDEWETPEDFFLPLHWEFVFDVDVAASDDNAKVRPYFGGVHSALEIDWHSFGRRPPTCWMNPPYSQCRAFIEKAALEARKGCTVVALVPSRTDTRWWHSAIWDAEKHTFRPGVEVRFIKGRLKFGGSKNSAPFPSAVVIFRPPPAGGIG